ncbi:MAG TPA: DUF4412 domain-containing protein [Chromatiales bacterium]|nr:DUF4412 domain-containing protein [Thiotrichales bacterium]HIP68045.1 DUF4412 domain-containing protein [Chromatiales bacterium]
MRGTFLTVIFLALTSGVSADTLIQFENTDKSMPKELSIKNGIAMLKDPQGRGRMVFDTVKEQMLMINDQRKEYIVINEAFIEKMAEAYQQQMDIMMKSLPPEQQKEIQQKIDQASNNKKAPNFSVKNTGKKRKINGIQCEINTVSDEANKIIETCLASAKDSGMDEKDYATYRKMSSLSGKLSRKSAKLTGPFAQRMQGNDIFSKLDGLPVEFKQLTNGQTSTITAIKNIKLDEKQFSTAGLKQADPFQRPPSPDK